MSSNVGELIDGRDFPGSQIIDAILSTAGGGFTVLQTYFTFDAQGHFLGQTGYLQQFGAGATAIGERVDLGATTVDSVHARTDGSFLASILQVESSSSGYDSELSLATISASGKLVPFYTTKLAPADGIKFDSDRDMDVAYGASGGIALARIGEGGSVNYRAVDIFDADLKLTSTVVVDRNTKTDEIYSTDVLALSDGRYLVTWVENNASGADVLARVITAAGKVSGATFVIGHSDDLATPAKVKLGYTTAALADGNFAVAISASESSRGSSIRAPLEAATWMNDGKGSFKHDTDLAQDGSLADPRLLGLVALSDGKILEVVKEVRALEQGVSLDTFYGYLHDERGTGIGEKFELYSEASTISYWTYVSNVVALDNGNFSLVKSIRSMSPGDGGSHDVIQVYSTVTADLQAVGGATAGDNTLKGASSSARADLIDGLGGNDKLYGYAGNDKLIGGVGNDWLDGGKGADRMEGGAGDDVYVVDNMGDKIIEAKGKGIDLVQASVSYTFTDNVDTLLFTGSNDVRGFGNALSNTLTGNSGRNVLYGLGGNDILNGGTKADVLNGGSGKDVFVFDTKIGKTNVDRIMDFVAVDDTIKLDDAVFSGLAKGTLKSAQFKDLSSGAIDASDRILFDRHTGELSYDVDGSGSTQAVQFARVGAFGQLTYADIVIF